MLKNLKWILWLKKLNKNMINKLKVKMNKLLNYKKKIMIYN